MGRKETEILQIAELLPNQYPLNLKVWCSDLALVLFTNCCLFLLLPLHVFFLFVSFGNANSGRGTREKAALTSEIKNPFTLLSHPFGAQPKEKQLLGWQQRGERDRDTEEKDKNTQRVRKGGLEIVNSKNIYIYTYIKSFF